MKPLVGIVMGSDSDLSKMKETAQVLESFGIACEVSILSAHRVPESVAEYARTAADRGLEVIVAGAGLAAHLPGVIAAHTTLPVVGVPLKAGALRGVDALYAVVQMPPGVPVATVAIDGAKNAGLLAAQIIGVKSPEIRRKMDEYKRKLAGEVSAKNARLQSAGIDGYLGGGTDG